MVAWHSYVMAHDAKVIFLTILCTFFELKTLFILCKRLRKLLLIKDSVKKQLLNDLHIFA
jgi:hypothetical protein